MNMTKHLSYEENTVYEKDQFCSHIDQEGNLVRIQKRPMVFDGRGNGQSTNAITKMLMNLLTPELNFQMSEHDVLCEGVKLFLIFNKKSKEFCFAKKRETEPTKLYGTTKIQDVDIILSKIDEIVSQDYYHIELIDSLNFEDFIVMSSFSYLYKISNMLEQNDIFSKHDFNDDSIFRWKLVRDVKYFSFFNTEDGFFREKELFEKARELLDQFQGTILTIVIEMLFDLNDNHESLMEKRKTIIDKLSLLWAEYEHELFSFKIEHTSTKRKDMIIQEYSLRKHLFKKLGDKKYLYNRVLMHSKREFVESRPINLFLNIDISNINELFFDVSKEAMTLIFKDSPDFNNHNVLNNDILTAIKLKGDNNNAYYYLGNLCKDSEIERNNQATILKISESDFHYLTES